ncbi:SMP-30/gluconolactonase/LRE family protein [Halalkalibaculum sp. DA384]|uniref:SMP-30/gluconolactonase/LRE family protein n=1 Tax=Halalkalibaculum sp. DA384 TaxID=3373606 RepID=UPI003754666A
MSIPSQKAELELEYDATLAECPVWDERENQLYWVDILSGILYRYDARRKQNTGFEIGEHVGSFAMREDRGAVLALKSGFAFYDFETRKTTHLSDPEAHLPNHRFNDGKCDPRGRFWAGTLSYDQQQGAGSLYMLNSNLSIDLKLRRLTIPNGMAWDTGLEAFYFIDSPDRTIYSFDFDEHTAEIDNRSVVLELDHPDALPDGMTIDTEGNLWVALYNGFKVICIDPGNGNTLYEVELPVPQVTSCTFGGDQLDELYITTAREHMKEEQVEKYPLSGSIFRAKVPFNGTPARRFAG